MSHKSVFSRNMKRARKEKGWSQEGAAAAIGIKRSVLGSYEEGRAEPGHDTLIQIANAYNVYDLYRFLNDPDYFDTAPTINEVIRKYVTLQGPIKVAVDALLGME